MATEVSPLVSSSTSLQNIEIASTPSLSSLSSPTFLLPVPFSPRTAEEAFEYSDPVFFSLFRFLGVGTRSSTTTSSCCCWIRGFLVACFSCVGEVLLLSCLSVPTHEKTWHVVSCVFLIVAFLFSTYMIHSDQLRRLFSSCRSISESQTRHILHIHFVTFWLLFVLGNTLGIWSIYTVMDDPTFSSILGQFVLAICYVSQIFLQTVLSAGISLFISVCHLQTYEWLHFSKKMANDGPLSLADNLERHVYLSDALSSMNKKLEGFLAGLIACTITRIVIDIYSVVLPGTQYDAKRFLWMLRFFHSSLLLLAPLIAAGFVTSRARRCRRVVARFRARSVSSLPTSYMHSDVYDDEVIHSQEFFDLITKEISSALLYLLAVDPGVKIFGVIISFGFVTQITITTFTVCAFVVQRTLTSSHS